jgi:hypothetical protein
MRKLALILSVVALLVSMYAFYLADASLHTTKEALRQVTAYVGYDQCDVAWPTEYGDMEFDGDQGLYRLMDDSIRRLCKSGRVCEVMGHQYRQSDLMHDDKTGMVHQSWRCALCGAGWERSGRNSDLLSKWEEAD